VQLNLRRMDRFIAITILVGRACNRSEMRSAMRSAHQKRPTVPSLASDLADLGRALRSLVDPYRPERHYMRGPGPRWHAKHDPAPARVDVSAVPALVTVHG
jgi:hypothetical protein